MQFAICVGTCFGRRLSQGTLAFLSPLLRFPVRNHVCWGTYIHFTIRKELSHKKTGGGRRGFFFSGKPSKKIFLAIQQVFPRYIRSHTARYSGGKFCPHTHTTFPETEKRKMCAADRDLPSIRYYLIFPVHFFLKPSPRDRKRRNIIYGNFYVFLDHIRMPDCK